MPKIPLFKQQSRISDDTPGVIYDASPELSAISSITSELTGGLGNLSKGIEQGIEKYEKLKDDASVADATRRLVDFENDLLTQKQEALKDPNIGYRNYEEKVLQPSINKFRESLQSSNYSSRVMPRIMQSADIEFGNMIRTERVDRVAKATAENIAILSKAANRLLLTEDKYEEGVKQFDDMVKNGYITSVTRDESISAANKTYYNNKVQNVTSVDDIQNIINENRFSLMEEEDQNSILNDANKRAQEYYTTVQATNLETAKKLLNDGKLDLDQIDALDFQDYFKKRFRDVYAKQIRQLKDTYKTGEGEDKPSVNIDNLERRIQTLFNGNFRGDATQEFKAIFEMATDVNMPRQLTNFYLEELVDKMKTPQGFNLFARGQKGSVYSPADAWAWEMYWKTYDDATTFVADDLKKRDMILRRNDFMQYLNDAKLSNLPSPTISPIEKSAKVDTGKYSVKGGKGKDPRSSMVARQKSTRAKSEYDEAVARTRQYGDPLEVDQNGNIIKNEDNIRLVNNFINKTFSEYVDIRTETNFNKSFGIGIPVFRPTIFDDYYMAPDPTMADPGKTRDQFNVEEDLRKRGLLPQAEG